MIVYGMKCVLVAGAVLALACGANEAASTSGTSTTSSATTATTIAASTTTAPSTTTAGPDVRLALLPPASGGPAAAAQGTLEVEGRCLYLRTPNGTRMLLLFATFDTRWDRAEGVLKVGDATYRPGEAVTLGGGAPNGMPADVAWVQAPDGSCRTDHLWVVISISRGAR